MGQSKTTCWRDHRHSVSRSLLPSAFGSHLMLGSLQRLGKPSSLIPLSPKLLITDRRFPLIPCSSLPSPMAPWPHSGHLFGVARRFVPAGQTTGPCSIRYLCRRQEEPHPEHDSLSVELRRARKSSAAGTNTIPPGHRAPSVGRHHHGVVAEAPTEPPSRRKPGSKGSLP